MTSGYWHVVLRLGKQSTHHIQHPLGQIWVAEATMFRLKIASDVFQERLDRVLRLLEGVHMELQITYFTHEETEIQYMVAGY